VVQSLDRHVASIAGGRARRCKAGRSRELGRSSVECLACAVGQSTLDGLCPKLRHRQITFVIGWVSLRGT
jgi:hypothetical protein